MRSWSTQTELQIKFCEGFTFHPFTALEQYGDFIYKQYSPAHGTTTVLDCHNSSGGAGARQPLLLLHKLQQHDLPLSAQLLELLLHAARLARQRRPSRVPGTPSAELREIVETFQRILKVYKENALQLMTALLYTACGQPGETGRSDIHPENLYYLQLLVKEFQHSTHIIFAFLSDCIRKAPGFEGLQPAGDEYQVWKRLKTGIAAFSHQQKKTIRILESWEKSQVQDVNQRLLN